MARRRVGSEGSGERRGPVRRRATALRPRSTPAAPGTITAIIQARAAAEVAVAEARRSHARLRDAIDILPEGIVFLDNEGRYILWNQKYEEIYRRSADLFRTGARLEDTLRVGVARGDYPEARGREEAWIAERLTKLHEPHSRHEQTLSDGRCILIEERHTAEGGIIGVRVDITELKMREASFRLLFDENPVPMFVFSARERTILAANDAALAHYGFDRDTLIGSPLGRIVAGADEPALASLDAVPEEEQAGQTWTHRKADGPSR